MRTIIRYAIPVTAAVLLAGCAGRGPEPAGATEADAAAVEYVQREMAAGRWDYETGLELIAAGEPALGSEVLEAATSRLRAAAAQCAGDPACDPAVLRASMQSILRWRPPASNLPALPAQGDSEILSSGSSGAPALDPDGPGDLLAQIRVNSHVRAALNEWLTWRRDDLADARRHYQFLRGSMQPIYEAAGLPEALLFAQLATESAGKVHAYSSAGAVGPLQFMNSTAMHYGLTMVDGFDRRLDPSAATRANAEYMKRHLRGFNNDLALVIAAYNAGESRLRRLVRQHPGHTFWDDEIFYALPVETRRHVPLVFAAALLFDDPARYGLAPRAQDYAISLLNLRDPISLGELSICLGDEWNPHGWFRTLRNLNPQLDPNKELPAQTEVSLPTAMVAVYAERCTGDTAMLNLARTLRAAEHPKQPAHAEYTVQEAGTLAAMVR